MRISDLLKTALDLADTINGWSTGVQLTKRMMWSGLETGSLAAAVELEKDSRERDEKTRDGDFDMVLQFRVAGSGLTIASTEACVKGRFTGSGGATYEFFGCDSVKVSP